MNYWKGGLITKLPPKCIFVFGSNPEGRHGAGAAKAAMSFGAVYGQGRGRQGMAYGLVTKNLTAGYVEERKWGDVEYQVTYPKAGERSVEPLAIAQNIRELYDYAIEHPDLKFLIGYTNIGHMNLNGYTPDEMGVLFRFNTAPSNVYMHESYWREGTDDGCKFFDAEPKPTKTNKVI